MTRTSTNGGRRGNLIVIVLVVVVVLGSDSREEIDDEDEDEHELGPEAPTDTDTAYLSALGPRSE
jgi:hypothetical protein